jgi:hypothetical protein
MNRYVHSASSQQLDEHVVVGAVGEPVADLDRPLAEPAVGLAVSQFAPGLLALEHLPFRDEGEVLRDRLVVGGGRPQPPDGLVHRLLVDRLREVVVEPHRDDVEVGLDRGDHHDEAVALVGRAGGEDVVARAVGKPAVEENDVERLGPGGVGLGGRRGRRHRRPRVGHPLGVQLP